MNHVRNHFYSYIAIAIATVLAGWYLLLPGYFSMHDDLQVTRQYQMDRCFHDYQIPCRWSPDLGGGHGFPLFNFYSPLPNYVGQVFVFLGSSYIQAIKLTFLLGLLVSGIGMYLLVYEIVQSRSSAFLASFLYLWAPYHSVDIFVRGALAESWALAWFPLIIWAIINRAKANQLLSPLISFTVAGLLLSHNLMSMWFAPIIAGFSIFVLFVYNRWTVKNFVSLCTSGLLGLGLVAFFILPALSEQIYVHTQTLTQDYFFYQNHFVSFFQLFFDRSWAYGASVWGPDDDMSFQLGWPHWWVLSGIVLLVSYQGYKSKFRFDAKQKWIIACALIWLTAIFMTHAKSVKIWEALPFLAITQFPWRLLGIAIFANSIVVGIGLSFIKKSQKVIILGIVLLTLSLNWHYFKPSGYRASMQDQDKLSGSEWPKQQRAAFLDYLPKTVTDFDLPVSNYQIELLPQNSQSRSENFLFSSNKFSLDVFNDGRTPIEVKIPIFDFPGWVIQLNNQPVTHTVSTPDGFIVVQAPPQQKSIIQGWFTNTKIRLVGNTITILSYVSILLILCIPRLIPTKNHRKS